MIMNPVIALLLASSSASAQVNWTTTPPITLASGYTAITTLKDAVQNKAKTADPAVTAGLTCDLDQSNRPISNT